MRGGGWRGCRRGTDRNREGPLVLSPGAAVAQVRCKYTVSECRRVLDYLTETVQTSRPLGVTVLTFNYLHQLVRKDG